MGEKVKIVNLNQTIEIMQNEIRYAFEIMLIKDDCVIIASAEDGTKNDIKFKRWDELDVLVGGKAKGVLYSCKSSVLGKIEHNGQILYAIKHPIPVSSINRREFYRYTLQVPVIATLYIDDKEEICYIDNISAGGLRIIYKHRIVEDRIRIEFLLEGGYKINSNCIIVNKGYRQKKPTSFYSLKFEEVEKGRSRENNSFYFS